MCYCKDFTVMVMTTILNIRPFCLFLVAGANPLQTNGFGHTARAYAKEGELNTLLQEWEGKVWHTPRTRTHLKMLFVFKRLFPASWQLYKSAQFTEQTSASLICSVVHADTHSSGGLCQPANEWQLLLSIRGVKAGESCERLTGVKNTFFSVVA